MEEWGEKPYRALFEASDIAQFVLDEQASIWQANAQCCKLLGIKKSSKFPLKLNAILADESLMLLLKGHKIALEKGEHQFEFKIQPNHFPSLVHLRTLDYDHRIFCLGRISENASNKEIENRILSAVIETEEKERSRFAKDLHDGLGPLLSTIKLYAHELNTDDLDPKERTEYLSYMLELLDEAIANTRNISNNITPQMLSNYGLIKSVESFCQKINASHKLQIHFTAVGVPEPLPKTLELTLFRVIIELINNTLKHAFASEIEIEIAYKDPRLQLTYADNGIGFDLEQALRKGSSGIGLVNILNRIKSMSGEFLFHRKSDKGIEIQMGIDLNPSYY